MKTIQFTPATRPGYEHTCSVCGHLDSDEEHTGGAGIEPPVVQLAAVQSFRYPMPMPLDRDALVDLAERAMAVRTTPTELTDDELHQLGEGCARLASELEDASPGAAKDRAQIADYAERLEIVGRQRDDARAQAEEHRIAGLEAEVAHDQALTHLDRCRDAVAAVHESSERAPDVRLVPMRLVHEEAWQRMLAAMRGR